MHFQHLQPVTDWVPHSYTRGVQIFRKCRNQLKILGARRVTWTRLRSQDPQMLGSTVPSSVARALWPAVLVRPWCLESWSSVWRAPRVSWELVKYVTSYFAPPHCSLLDTTQACGKFIAFQRKPPQTAHRSVWSLHYVRSVSGCFLLPAFNNCTSQQLAVHLRRTPQQPNSGSYGCWRHATQVVQYTF
jgi:hypothetical protein